MTGTRASIAARLRDELHEQCFTPVTSGDRSRIGAEVEFLVLDADTRRPLPLDGPERNLLRMLRSRAERGEWLEGRTTSGTPSFEIPGRGVITFEPGGQIEISTVAAPSPNHLLESLDVVVGSLRTILADEGVELLAAGIDPLTPIECVPLQLHVDRYERMTRYFDRIGPFGIRMMRQTAAVQVSLDRGERPAERWQLLNDLAPYLIAMFANSPRYVGEDTRHKSFRARCWRMLDATRTGIAGRNGDPAAAYTSFALDAHDMMREDERGEYRPFGDWIAAGEWDDARWARHLTTLFPEVRPRGHFEVRSCDAVDPTWYPATVVFLAGLVYDPQAATEARRLVGNSAALLSRAGQCGLTDPTIARTVRDLVHVALAGAQRLPGDYLAREHVERARDILVGHTCRGRSPADLLSS